MKINNLGVFQDSEGTKYELLEKVSQIQAKTISNASTKVSDGKRSYETACGTPVNFENGKFVTWDDIVLMPI